MPELPEVETTRRGIEPHIVGAIITKFTAHTKKLRWDISPELTTKSLNQEVLSVERRAKYLLINIPNGTIIMHLGMSGKLKIIDDNSQMIKHDHVEICFNNGKILRLNDPRRFGAVLWCEGSPFEHILLRDLGPEPFKTEFNADYLLNLSKKRKTQIKSFIMNSKIVVGIGNIYASEILFNCKIHPSMPSNKLTLIQANNIVKHSRKILTQAIAKGGTTLRDFLGSDGKPGYFSQALQVYGRENQSCIECNSNIKAMVIGQRNTYYCPHCQK